MTPYIMGVLIYAKKAFGLEIIKKYWGVITVIYGVLSLIIQNNVIQDILALFAVLITTVGVVYLK